MLRINFCHYPVSQRILASTVVGWYIVWQPDMPWYVFDVLRRLKLRVCIGGSQLDIIIAYARVRATKPIESSLLCYRLAMPLHYWHLDWTYLLATADSPLVFLFSIYVMLFTLCFRDSVSLFLFQLSRVMLLNVSVCCSLIGTMHCVVAFDIPMYSPTHWFGRIENSFILVLGVQSTKYNIEDVKPCSDWP